MTNQQFPKSSFLPFTKRSTMSPYFQPPGTWQGCQEFPRASSLGPSTYWLLSPIPHADMILTVSDNQLDLTTHVSVTQPTLHTKLILSTFSNPQDDLIPPPSELSPSCAIFYAFACLALLHLLKRQPKPFSLQTTMGLLEAFLTI